MGRHCTASEAAIRHPLSPWLYFRRNPGRTLPVVFVIVVAVALIASVVSLIDSIDLTVMTMYGYQRFLCAITPRNALAVNEDVTAQVHRDPLAQHVYTMRPAITTVNTIFGKMPFVVFGLSPGARDDLMRRCGLRMVAGRLPAEGQPEVAVHADIARNRHLRLGDVVLKPEIEDSYCVIPVRLVGTFDGPVWLAVTSEAFVRDKYPVNPQGLVVVAPNEEKQRVLDSHFARSLPKETTRLWTYATLVRDTREALSSLYLIMNVVIGITIFAIAFLTGMLANIYFMQRIPEFATLAAIGYQRAGLLARVLGETALLCVLGWALGSLLTIAVLEGIKGWVMTPRGLLLDPFDIGAYRYTIPLPLTIALFAVVPIGRRLRRLDPVTIIERRQ